MTVSLARRVGVQIDGLQVVYTQPLQAADTLDSDSPTRMPQTQSAVAQLSMPARRQTLPWSFAC